MPLNCGRLVKQQQITESPPNHRYNVGEVGKKAGVEYVSASGDASSQCALSCGADMGTAQAN